MDKLLDSLYQKFFLRDVLSIMFCGLLVLGTFWLYNPLNLAFFEYKNILKIFLLSKSLQLSLLSYLIIISFSYMIGLIINFIRDRIQYFFLGGLKGFMKPKWKLHYNVSTFFTNYINFNNITENKTINESMIERMTFMFQFSGNLAITMLLCMVNGYEAIINNIRLIIPLLLTVALLVWVSVTKFIERNIYLNKVIANNAPTLTEDQSVQKTC